MIESDTLDSAELFEGVPPAEREQHAELLHSLREAGASEEQIRRAMAEGRLALLPTELILARNCSYTLEEAIERSGLDPEFAVRNLLATGQPRPAPGERVLSEINLEAMKRVKQALDAGISEETALRIASVFGRGIAQIADGTVDLIVATLVQEARSEAEFALRSQGLTEAMREDLNVYLAATMDTHLRERLARGVLTRAEVEAGKLPGAREAAVCFADLVGFTRISEHSEPEEAGRLATGLAELATQCAEPPVRLVKMIGDEAMLVAEDLGALAKAAFRLRDSAEREGLPPLRVGLTVGPAIERAGDWYGRTVNLASRITAVAPEGAIVAPRETCNRLGGRYPTEALGRFEVKGLDELVDLCRLDSESG